MIEPINIILGKNFLQNGQIILNFVIMIEIGKKYKKIAKGDLKLLTKYFLEGKNIYENWINIKPFQRQLENLGVQSDLLKDDLNPGKIYATIELKEPQSDFQKKVSLYPSPVGKNENNQEIQKNRFDDDLSDVSISIVETKEEEREGLELDQFIEGGAGSRAACHRNARTTLPYPHAYNVALLLGKLYVAAVGESLMVLQYAAILRHVEGLYIFFLVKEYHEVRIAHRYPYALKLPAAAADGKLRILCHGFAHVNLRTRHHAFFVLLQPQGLDACQSLKRHHLIISKVMVAHELSAAPHAITTHHGLRTVTVENPHAEVCHFAAVNGNQSVTANTKTLAAPVYRSLPKVCNWIVRQVHINIVVSATMHFSKVYPAYSVCLCCVSLCHFFNFCLCCVSFLTVLIFIFCHFESFRLQN